MRLDTLIVSKTRPARMGDDRNAAARALEGEAGRIDIAQRLNGWIGGRCRRRRHKHRLVLENESRHVVIVDRHVTERATRNLELFDRQRARVFRDNGDKFNITDVAGADALADFCNSGIEAPIETQEKRCFAVFDRGKAVINAINR
jgi:hypothetical protein